MRMIFHLSLAKRRHKPTYAHSTTYELLAERRSFKLRYSLNENSCLNTDKIKYKSSAKKS